MGNRGQVSRRADCRRGRRPVSVCSVRDAVSATVQAVDRGSPGIYNVVGDEPAPQAEWLPYLVELLDAPPPRRVSEEEAEEQIGAQAVYYGTQLRELFGCPPRGWAENPGSGSAHKEALLAAVKAFRRPLPVGWGPDRCRGGPRRPAGG
jgi:hypothetical protein